MPKPHSNDFRERVVSYVEAGHSRRAAAAHFRVSPSFVVNLMSLFASAGRVIAEGARWLATQTLDPHRVYLAPGGGGGRHQHAGAGR